MLNLKPIHRAALTSCSLMTLGDAACQAIQCQRNRRPVRIDTARAARFGLIGLTLHGPFFFKYVHPDSWTQSSGGRRTEHSSSSSSSSSGGDSPRLGAALAGASLPLFDVGVHTSAVHVGNRGFQWLDGKFGTAKTLQNAVTKSLVGQATLFPTYTSLVLLYSSLLEGRSIQEACEQVKHKLPKLFVTGSVYWPTVNVANFMFVPPQQRVLAVNGCAMLWNMYLSYVNAAPLSIAREAAAS